MDLDYFQISFLAFLQGLTEYLPISSSAHILLPKELLGWPDQGLVFDVAVHIGSLLAVLTYFRADLLRLYLAWQSSLRAGAMSPDARLAWFVVAGTIPAGIAGVLLSDLIELYARNMLLIAFTSIFFGILLWWSDNRPLVRVGIEQLTLRTTLIVGLAQVLALIPGTSRSGVTMTAALACGLDRKAAARFSFLLAIPIIAASGLLKGGELLRDEAQAQWGVLAYAVLVSALVSFSCIHYFLKLIERMGFLPFVIYRVLMGLGLLYVHYFVQA